MALSGAVLNTAIKAAVLAELQAQFPVSASLTADEQTAYNANQVKLATAIAACAGSIVTHIVSSTIVAGTVTTGVGAGGLVVGTVS
jgi:hypothetical protein